MNIKTEFVTLGVEDGTSLKAYVARPEGTPKAGLIVFQEIFGVNHHIRDITERFGREGYLAIAPELFHRSAPGFESGYTDMGPGFEQAMKTTDAGFASDTRASYQWIQSQAKIPTASIGYRMGGRVSTIAAMTVPLACGVSYYGGGIAPNPRGPGILDRLKEVNSPMLFFWGGLDQHITPEHVQMIAGKLREAKKTFTNVEISDADHGFFCDARASYSAKAAALAWPLTLAYLETHTQKAAGA